MSFTESAKEVTGGKRLYGNVESDLLYAYDMEADGPAAAAAPVGAGWSASRPMSDELAARLRTRATG